MIKQKIVIEFKLEEEAIIHVLNQLRNENINGMIIKSEADLSKMKESSACFQLMYDTTCNFKSKNECE